jgi:nicotinamide-nucleotide amidase
VDAAIIAVGSELLQSERAESNSLRLSGVLERHGVRLVRKAVVGDDPAAIVAELGLATRQARLLVLTGGLGPTQDDLTREAVAAWSQRALREEAGLVDGLRARYAAYGRPMPVSNLRQAQVIEGAEVLDNPAGTAPGLRLEHAGATLFLFPGPPRELEVMAERHLVPWLERQPDRESGLEQVEVRLACVPESAVEDRLAPVYEAFSRERIMVLARPGEVRVLVRVDASAPGNREAIVGALRAALGDALFAVGPVDLAEAVLDALRERAQTLAVAESCTGGLLGSRLTAVAGSSEVFVGGVISYSNALKVRLLGVSEDALARHGAVSEPVARAMAEGARTRLGAHHALAITGVAGPGGGSAEKPVGTVDLALASEGSTRALRARFPGNREQIRWQASQLALDMLRRSLTGLPFEVFWAAPVASSEASLSATGSVSPTGSGSAP